MTHYTTTLFDETIAIVDGFLPVAGFVFQKENGGDHLSFFSWFLGLMVLQLMHNTQP